MTSISSNPIITATAAHLADSQKKNILKEAAREIITNQNTSMETKALAIANEARRRRAGKAIATSLRKELSADPFKKAVKKAKKLAGATHPEQIDAAVARAQEIYKATAKTDLIQNIAVLEGKKFEQSLTKVIEGNDILSIPLLDDPVKMESIFNALSSQKSKIGHLRHVALYLPPSLLGNALAAIKHLSAKGSEELEIQINLIPESLSPILDEEESLAMKELLTVPDSKVKTLILDNQYVSDDAVRLLIEGVQDQNNNLQQLFAQHAEFTKPGFSELVKSLLNSPKLTGLVLPPYMLDPDLLLENMTKPGSQLKFLSVSLDPMTQGQALRFRDKLLDKKSTLERLHIDSHPKMETGMLSTDAIRAHQMHTAALTTELVDVLVNDGRLLDMQLSYPMTDEEISLISKNMSDFELSRLSLKECHLSDEAVLELLNSVDEQSSLTELDLTDNNITSKPHLLEAVIEAGVRCPDITFKV